ncbi:hypothetical protein QRD43_12285 [Pelomonas sp. APW6]|uniref:TonB C-terminal domain-containing protein n=1 Tax=Roseateles subflavus TaxID=3053353 RepID=A0ABT7LIL6_9BURK|nr:hypothetical protein [Pelomonas sp. APW6]MDL5032684.1 hypothetical protein [Pelomonas sp. APW6]
MSPRPARPPLYAVVGALLLHGGLVVGSLAAGTGAPPSAARRPPAVLIVPQRLPPDSPRALTAVETDAPAPDVQPDRPPLSPAVRVLAPPEEEISPEQQALEAQLARDAAATNASLEAVSRMWAEYLPASELTVRPQIRELFQLPWPEGSELLVGQVFRGRFKIYVDELGQVRRVVPERGTLLEGMEQVVTQTFLRAHYAAGWLGDRQVKAWVEIEVEYDARGMLTTRVLN